jgi:hypothetical protein
MDEIRIGIATQLPHHGEKAHREYHVFQYDVFFDFSTLPVHFCIVQALLSPIELTKQRSEVHMTRCFE